ncbi:MAG: MASE3 domain-containing protein [Desulfomonilia bacterium]|jgi:signal transduction histidine kinase/CheY-like chemotaxis protein|nr:MASE3 domain-containing protein [Desulfomonilia bacterium]
MKQPENRGTREAGSVLETGAYVLLGALTLLLLHLTTLHSYTLFHSIAEGFCITISVGVFMFAWNSRRLMDNNYVLFLGIASLFIGLLDGLHALAYKGMGVFDTPGANLATELWILTRYMHAVSFLAALIFLKRAFRPSGVFAAFTAVTVLALLSIFHWDIFPDCYVEGTGLTAFKIGSEYVISLIFIASLGAVLAYRRSFDSGVLRLIAGGIVFNVAAELSFTRYLGVYDLSNQLGHLFKIAAYYLLYRAVISTGLKKPYGLMFRDLVQSREELGRTNVTLQQHVHEQSTEIARRMEAERERETVVEFLRRANEIRTSGDLVRMVVEFFQQESGCQAVAVRLERDGDYPYSHASGFPEEFVRLENLLCWQDDQGGPARHDPGKPALECLCGSVILGNVPSSMPFFTGRGSFWTNSTTKLASGTIEEDLKIRLRNRCNVFGYESVALIPLRSGEERLGLVQLCDHREGLFSPPVIALWERLTDYLVAALTRILAEESLQRMAGRFELLTDTAGELLRAKEPRKAVDSLCRKVMEYLNCQAYFNYLLDEKSETLHLNAFAGILKKEAARIEHLDYRAVYSGESFRKGCPIMAGDSPAAFGLEAEQIKAYGIRAYACHPLQAEGGRVIGTLSFGARNREAFSREDLSLMKAVTDQIAAAVVRLKTEEEVRRHRDHLEEIVRERTAELEARNRQLEEEISERMRTEEEKANLESQLIQAQKMEALGRFAGGIAHDLSNMLYPIILNLQVLAQEVPFGDSRDQTVRLVLSAAYRQRDLLRQILSFSRRNEQQLKPVAVSGLIQETVTFLRSSLPSTIEIALTNGAQNDSVLGNATQIQQIVMNLCRNAADAIEPHTGTIEVALANVDLPEELAPREIQAGEYLQLTVSDTGIGMTPEIMGRIFDPFYTTKDVGKGSGMGLSVIHGIVKAHGGAVRVESTPGEGSLFTVYLPTTRETSEELPVQDPGTPGKPDKRSILLVDDEAIILSSVSKVLKILGYEVTPAGSGADALSLFSANPDAYDLVITDQTMPQMTGVDLATEITGIRPGVPVILCSGFSDTVSEKKLADSGIRALLSKPADMQELKSAIEKALKEAAPGRGAPVAGTRRGTMANGKG